MKKHKILSIFATALAAALFALAAVACDTKRPETPVAPGEDGLVSLTIFRFPSKTEYYIGETFDPSGMVLKASYEDGTTVNLLYDDCVYNREPLTEADTVVEITFGSQSAQIPVTVTPTPQIEDNQPYPTEIIVGKAPDKTAYVLGETFNPEGMVIKALYNDGSSKNVSMSLLEYSNSPLKETDEFVTVTYGRFSVDVPISVSRYAVRIENDENVVHRMEAEATDLSNLKLVGWAEGKSPVETGLTASGGAFLANLSSSQGYVEYGVYSAVEGKVTLYIYCAAGTEAGKNMYIDSAFEAKWNGDVFITDAVIACTTWTDFQKIRLGCVNLKKGDNTLRLSKKGNCPNFDCVDFDVNNPADEVVPILKNISITRNPRTEYIEGETFDPEGMTVTAEYTDGSSEEIPTSQLSYPTRALAETDTFVTVAYKSFTVKLDITVTAPELLGIECVTAPTRTQYVKGEVFDPTGIVVRANYAGDISRILRVSELEYSAAALAETDAAVTVSYCGFEISVAISVSKYSIKIESAEHKTYRLEAENADLSTFTVNGNYNIVENNANASGGKQLCNLWAVSGYVDYGVYSEIEGIVSIYIYVATGVDGVKADTAFSMTWNGTAFVTGADVPNKGWATIQKIYLGCVKLEKGENVLRLTKKGTCPNFDCVDFIVNDPLDALDSDYDVKIQNGFTSRVCEAETLAVSGTPANGEGKKFVKDGGKAVENLGVKDNTVTIEIYSQSATTVNISFTACQAYGSALDFAEVFSATLNGEAADLSASIPSNANWNTYAETALGTLELKQGRNVLVFTVKRTGTAPNIDCFTFTPINEEN